MNCYDSGNFICALRESKGLTQQEVADMLGVTPAAVSKWENGSSRPRVKVLFELAEILGVRAEEIVAGKFLPKETIDAEAAKRINERYEYLSKIESYAFTSVKLKRLIASFIDLLAAVALMWLIASSVYRVLIFNNVDRGNMEVVCFLSLICSFLLFFGFRDFVFFGRSLGKRIFGMVVLDKKTGNEARIKKRLLRNIITFVFMSYSVPFICVDAIIMLVRGQSVGDSVAGTVVVEKEDSKKKCNCKEDRREDNITNTNEKEFFAKQNDALPQDIDFQKINAYVSPPKLDKKFMVRLISVIAIIIMISIGLIAFYFVKYDSCEAVSTDITKYEDDRVIYENASDFMPELGALTDHTDVFYSHKTNVYSKFMGFVSEGMALFLKYDESVYEDKKTEILNSYTFLNEPVVDNVYELPVTEFYYKNYHMKVIPDKKYVDFCACKSFALIGFDDENKNIVYCYQYNFDLDYIAELGDDLELEMCEFMDNVFEFKDVE